MRSRKQTPPSSSPQPLDVEKAAAAAATEANHADSSTTQVHSAASELHRRQSGHRTTASESDMPAPSPAGARTSAQAARLNPLWYQYACATVVAAVVLGNLLRWAFLDWADPYHCNALLTEGKWLDPGTYKNWQPEGCYQKPVGAAGLASCLSSPGVQSPTAARERRIIFVGDSSVRQLFFGTVRALNANATNKDHNPYGKTWETNGGEKHTNRVAVFDAKGSPAPKSGAALTIDFWW